MKLRTNDGHQQECDGTLPVDHEHDETPAEQEHAGLMDSRFLGARESQVWRHTVGREQQGCAEQNVYAAT